MATRPLPSLDWPSLLSRAYMFFSEKLQPRKSKWAELTAISLGYSMFSTCTQRKQSAPALRCTEQKVLVLHLVFEDKQISQGHNSKHLYFYSLKNEMNSTFKNTMTFQCHLTTFKSTAQGGRINVMTFTCWLSSGRLFPYMKHPRLEAWPCKST